METPMHTRCSMRSLAMAVVLGTTVTSFARAQGGAPARVASPDGRTVVTVQVRDGKLFYDVQRDGHALVQPSRLGIAFQGAPALSEGLRVESGADSSADEWWTQPW